MEETERERFDLKLQMYYTNQKSSTIKSSLSYEGPETLASLIEDHCVDTLALREANYSARRRISDLESELAELKAKRDAEHSVYQSEKKSNCITALVPKISISKPSADIHIDENRRREKQAALAISEHDAILIRKLETEVVGLRSQHECDVKLVKDATATISNLLNEVAEKDKRISDQEQASKIMETQLSLLTEHMQSAQLLIENGLRDHQIVLEYALMGNKGNSDWPRKDEPDKRKGLQCLTDKPSYRGNCDKSLADKSLELKMQRSPTAMSDYVSSTDMKRSSRKEFLKQNSSISNDHNNLLIENAELLAMLRKERAKQKIQEEALNQVRASAEEITLLEAEEIARLESELEKCHDEKVDWEKRCLAALLNVKQLTKLKPVE